MEYFALATRTACKAVFATSRETSQPNDAHEISLYINNVIQKNPPNYCQGLSMFPVPDNKNVRNYNPLAGVENSQQICYRARREIDKPRATTKQSASSTMEHVRAVRERSDNVQRQRASARDAILQASLRHGAHICCSTTSVQQSSNLIKSDLWTQCSHFERTNGKMYTFVAWTSLAWVFAARNCKHMHA